nr:RHS repeat-associated core domain-containing protein [Brenneria sp. L3-3C-1]
MWQGLRLLEERSGDGQKLYVYEPDSYAPLARIDGSGDDARLYYFHTDQIGTPLDVTDEDGALVWQASYKAWGEVETYHTQAIEQNLRFHGQYFDDETGLHYNTFRYYDPGVGRFVTQDPIGLQGTQNLYQYAPNPNIWMDPLGWIHESAPGYNVYGLFDKGADKPYYVGITDDLSRRRTEHVGTGRMNGSSIMRPLDENITYGQARGYEQAYIDHYQTKTGIIGEEISPQNRGNKINSYDKNNTTRRASRQANFDSNYQAKTNSLKPTSGGC